VSFSSEGIQRVDEKIEDSFHTATTMTLSPDGKWMWDGSNWIPAPPQEAPEELIEQPVVDTQPEPKAVLPTGFPPAGRPPTTASANPPAINVTKDSVNGTMIDKENIPTPLNKKMTYSLAIVLAITVITLFVEHDEKATMEDIAAYCFYIFTITSIFVFPCVFAHHFIMDFLRKRNDLGTIQTKAEIEFASGNIEKAMKYYKMAGDLEKLRECAELLERQQPHQITSSQQSEIYSQHEAISMSDSVVSGDVHYHLNQPQAEDAVHSDEPQVSPFMKIGRIIAIVITITAAVLKIGVEIMT